MTEMVQQSVPQELDAPEAPTFVDYFGFQSTTKWYLPDGVQYFEIQVMNEGMKAKFQKSTSKDLIMERKSGDARMRVNPADERHQLIKTCVVNWNLYRGGKPQPFGERALQDFLQLTDPRLVEDLEKEIRKANPWLLGEMSVEDIDKEIENLKEMREVAAEREAGEASSSSR